MSAGGPGGIEQLKASMRAAWMSGDFGVIARTVGSSADAFVEGLSIPAGARVLDVACGTGNVALPLARRGALVTGVDIAANLIAQARERAAAEGLTVEFDEGDVEQLPYSDSSFDVVVSMFGAMFAPRPEVVAGELARVVKSGGRLAMANWNPGSFSGQMFKVTARYVAPPPGIPPPVLWGEETIVRERLAPYFREIETAIIPIDFDLAMSPAETVAFFRRYFGPSYVAFSRLNEPGQAALATELEALWAGANVAGERDKQTLVRNEYLRVTATRV